MKRVHINVKELTAVELALRSFQPHVSGQVIRVNTDNQVTLSYLKNFTGRKPELEAVARRIMKFCLTTGHTVTNSTDTLQGLWSLPGAAKSTPSEVERRQ
jgi:hypothetical protein